MTSDARMANEGVDRGALHFPLQDNEQVLEIVRKHWVYLWPRSILLLLYALVPLVAVGVLLSLIDQFDGMVRNIFFIAAAVWLLYWLVRIFLNWYRYNNDIWVVTNQRIVDSVKNHPFNLRISTADLVNIQDMTIERNGVLRSMLNFGDIVCETASQGRDFVLSGIPDPQGVQLLVDRERDRERRGAR